MKNQSHPKLNAIIDAIQSGQVQVALKEITALTSKQKNKDRFSQDQLEILNLLRALCLSKADQLGEAKQILIHFMEIRKEFTGDPELSLWLSNIASHYDFTKELRIYFDPYFALNDKDDKISNERLNMLIKERNFSDAQTQAIKLFKLTNKPRFFLLSIYLQYLDKVNNPKSNLKNDLKLPEMFLNKHLKDQKVEEKLASAQHERIDQQAVKLSIEFMRRQEKEEDAFKQIVKYNKLINDPDYVIRNLTEIYEKTNSEEVLKTLTVQIFSLFNQNNDLTQFRYSYEVFRDFFNLIFTRLSEDQVKSIGQELEKDSEIKGSTFVFNEELKEADIGQIVRSFWYGLENSKRYVTEKFSTNANLKNSYKTILTLQLDACAAFLHKTQQSSFRELIKRFLKEYCEHFRLTFTLAEEIYPYVLHLEKADRETIYQTLETLYTSEKTLNGCLTDISLQKLKWAFDFGDLTHENVEQVVRELITKFGQHMSTFYSDFKGVEKGERLVNDDYLLLAADILLTRLHAQSFEALTQQDFELLIFTLYTLELGTAISPYNHDMKLRLMYLYGVIGAPDRAQEVYKNMDIKAIQLDTLGYVFFTPHAQFSLEDQVLDLCRDGLRYQIENMRESKESVISCIKNDNLEKIPEFFKWEKLIASSWFKVNCALVYFESEVRANLKKEQDGSNLISGPNMEVDYYAGLIDAAVDKVLQDPSQLSMNFDMIVSQPLMTAASIKAKQPIKHNFSLNTFLGIYDSKYTTIARFARVSLLNLLTRETSEQYVKQIDKQLDNLALGIKDLNNAGFDAFWIHNRREELLKPNDNDKLNKSMVASLLTFEGKCLELEHTLFTAAHKWQTLNNEDASNAYTQLSEALKKIDGKFKDLETHFGDLLSQEDSALPPKIFLVDLKNSARFITRLTETFAVIGSRIINMKSNINKALKKVKDEELKKKYTVLLKEYNNVIKAEALVALATLERLVAAYSRLTKIFKDGSFKAVEKLESHPLMKVVDDGKIIEKDKVLGTLKDAVKRNYVYIISTLEGKIKDRVKSIKALST